MSLGSCYYTFSFPGPLAGTREPLTSNYLKTIMLVCPRTAELGNYCGCREFPLIGQRTGEHEAIADAAGRLTRAVRHGGADPAACLDALLALLGPHTAAEEGGLFVELRAEGSLAGAVDTLCAEHVDIHGVLGAVDRANPDWPDVLTALDRLHRHIDNEEHGLFPAAVIALPMDAWDRVTPDLVQHGNSMLTSIATITTIRRRHRGKQCAA